METADQQELTPVPVGQFDEGAFWHSGQLAVVGTRSELQGVLGRCVGLDKSRALKRTLSMLFGWGLVLACLGLIVYALVDNGSLGMVAGAAGGTVVLLFTTLFLMSHFEVHLDVPRLHYALDLLDSAPWHEAAPLALTVLAYTINHENHRWMVLRGPLQSGDEVSYERVTAIAVETSLVKVGRHYHSVVDAAGSGFLDQLSVRPAHTAAISDERVGSWAASLQLHHGTQMVGVEQSDGAVQVAVRGGAHLDPGGVQTVVDRRLSAHYFSHLLSSLLQLTGQC